MSARPSRTTMARYAAMWLCCAAFIAASTQGCSRRPAPIDPAVQHGYALAYIEGRFSGAYRVETTITMPPRAANKAWTANYIMVAGKRSETLSQPMYQVGLIRLAASPHTLRTFFATEPHGGKLVYREIGPVPDAPHRMALASNHGSLTIEVDDRVVRSFKRKDMFSSDDHLYVQLGAEAVTPGDAVAGTFRNITVAFGDAKPKHVFPACRYNDRGLALRRDDRLQQLEAFGTYTPGTPSVFIDCH
jgi:hypothetical protein